MNLSEKFWDKMSEHMDERTEEYGQAHTKAVENIIKYLRAGDVVLDYGCGTGIFTYKIADRVKEVHGIDMSSKMIQAAQRKAGEHKSENIEFSQSTIFDEKLKKASFDVILAVGILHLLADPPKAIQRINELLKPGGLFISSTPCMVESKSILILISNVAFLLGRIGIVPLLRFFKISELEHSITNGNFQIIETASLAFDASHDPAYIFARFIAAKKV